MPKYTPTLEDMYKTKPCLVCGLDVVDNEETCSSLCQQQWEIFKEDFNESLMAQYDCDNKFDIEVEV